MPSNSEPECDSPNGHPSTLLSDHPASAEYLSGYPASDEHLSSNSAASLNQPVNSRFVNLIYSDFKEYVLYT